MEDITTINDNEPLEPLKLFEMQDFGMNKNNLWVLNRGAIIFYKLRNDTLEYRKAVNFFSIDWRGMFHTTSNNIFLFHDYGMPADNGSVTMGMMIHKFNETGQLLGSNFLPANEYLINFETTSHQINQHIIMTDLKRFILLNYELQVIDKITVEQNFREYNTWKAGVILYNRDNNGIHQLIIIPDLKSSKRYLKYHMNQAVSSMHVIDNELYIGTDQGYLGRINLSEITIK